MLFVFVTKFTNSILKRLLVEFFSKWLYITLVLNYDLLLTFILQLFQDIVLQEGNSIWKINDLEEVSRNSLTRTYALMLFVHKCTLICRLFRIKCAKSRESFWMQKCDMSMCLIINLYIATGFYVLKTLRGWWYQFLYTTITPTLICDNTTNVCTVKCSVTVTHVH
jgi:hypothetical protein